MKGRATRNCFLRKLFAQRGLTLVELMISLVMGLFVVLAATALLLASKASYTAQNQASIVREMGRYAIENISRSLRQAAFENWDTESSGAAIPQAPIVTTPDMSANLAGQDNASMDATSAELQGVSTGGVNGSDVLAVRYFGVGQDSGGSGKDGFGSIVNCAGFAVPAPVSQAAAEADRGWSIYYVKKDSAGVPELRCKYRGTGAWNSVAFARGVESFQVLYGVDTDADRIPNQYMTATQVTALDSRLDATEKHSKTAWKKIAAVKVALLVRGEEKVQGGMAGVVYDLFGQAYSAAHGATDKGSQVRVSQLAGAVQNRERQLFQTTVQYRNAVEGSGTAEGR